jgi:signal transduction histidine kinase
VTAKDGQIFWAFELPEGLRDKKGEQRFQDGQLVMQLPSWCRELLNKGARLSDAQLEELWQTLQTVSQRATTQDENDELPGEFFHPAHSVAGLIAVLVILHRDWLRVRLDRENWCREKLLAFLSEPPPMASYHPHENVDFQFDGFAAQTVPVFWAEQPQSREWRQAVFQLALSRRLKTVALLCRASAEERSRLGRAFHDLQSLLFQCAAAPRPRATSNVC